MRWVHDLMERIRAHRRGERRIAPAAVRGRVYEKVHNESRAGGIRTRTRLKPAMRLRIWRAATGQWEDGPEVK